MSFDGLVPVESLFSAEWKQRATCKRKRDGEIVALSPDEQAKRWKRWIADACRGVKASKDAPRRPPLIPNAVRIGKMWMVRPSDFAAFIAGRKPGVPTEDEALAELRARGVL